MILEDREKRFNRQFELSNEYKKPLVVIKVNYPGEKDNYIVNTVLDFLDIDIEHEYYEEFNSSEGPVKLFVSNESAEELKRKGIVLENTPFGRLIDFDVYNEEFELLSRKDFNLPPRTCVICGNVAHECIRSMAHSLEETREAFDDIYIYALSSLLGRLAKESLLEELDLHPKPGLVTPFSSGAHKDMDYDLMRKSIEAIDFSLLAEASFESYDYAKEIGAQLEQDMFDETNGVNTHKGAIFLLGSIIYGYIHSLRNGSSLEESLKIINKGATKLYENEAYSSNGKSVFLKTGLKGILGDAEDGFPLLFKFNEEGTKLLKLLMKNCDDSTILHRHGLETLNYVKEAVSNKSFEELNEIFVDKNISPGGSADLYSGVMLVRKLKAINN